MFLFLKLIIPLWIFGGSDNKFSFEMNDLGFIVTLFALLQKTGCYFVLHNQRSLVLLLILVIS